MYRRPDQSIGCREARQYGPLINAGVRLATIRGGWTLRPEVSDAPMKEIAPAVVIPRLLEKARWHEV